MSGLFLFLLILQTLVTLVMITVILMQRSEGGGLAGGSPSGLMTARGAADFLTRTTAISATIFVALSILLAALAAGERGAADDRSQPGQAGAGRRAGGAVDEPACAGRAGAGPKRARRQPIRRPARAITSPRRKPSFPRRDPDARRVPLDPAFAG